MNQIQQLACHLQKELTGIALRFVKDELKKTHQVTTLKTIAHHRCDSKRILLQVSSLVDMNTNGCSFQAAQAILEEVICHLSHQQLFNHFGIKYIIYPDSQNSDFIIKPRY
ncbi:hypothetical protein IJJ27_03990 [bacterium]|nr:hypothetical protein [bacterium]